MHFHTYIGGISVYQYPVLKQHAEHLAYSGHSSHVTSVHFSYDDRYLLSTGGHDLCGGLRAANITHVTAFLVPLARRCLSMVAIFIDLIFCAHTVFQWRVQKAGSKVQNGQGDRGNLW
jgi:hypothetical protein